MGCGVSRVDCVVEPTQELSPRKKVNGYGADIITPIKNGGILTKETKVTQYDDVVTNGRDLRDAENNASDEKISPVDSSSRFDTKKSRLYSSLDMFAEADNTAMNAPSSLKSSTTELVDYLVKHVRNTDLLRLRVIWRWITHNISYDVDSYFNSDDKSIYSEDTTDVLLSGKSVCSGYSNLFKVMGKLAGLQVECIPGWSKGYAFLVGTKFTGSCTNHLWNAAMIDGSWWLFDCTWGAGYIDDNKNFVHEYDEHFFMTNPKQFIYDHFPKNPAWQLLDSPITIEDYENMALFTKCFFNLHMKPVTHEKYMIDCDNGKVHLKFKIDKNKPVKCAGSLTNSEGIHAGDTYLHIYTTDKVLHTYVTAPGKGEFTLKLFADGEESVTNDHVTLPLICTYLINCSNKLDSVHTYPKQFKKWCHGFMLHSPMNGELCVGETYHFKVSVTDVCKMAVCLGGKKASVVYMENTNSKVWESDVKIERGTERITVVAKFTNCKNTTFSSLLEYTVSSNMCILSDP